MRSIQEIETSARTPISYGMHRIFKYVPADFFRDVFVFGEWHFSRDDEMYLYG